jgi:hypothetical protein
MLKLILILLDPQPDRIFSSPHQIQGYIITNMNDYAINPLIPKTTQGKRKRDMDSEGNLLLPQMKISLAKFVKHNICI